MFICGYETGSCRSTFHNGLCSITSPSAQEKARSRKQLHSLAAALCVLFFRIKGFYFVINDSRKQLRRQLQQYWSYCRKVGAPQPTFFFLQFFQRPFARFAVVANLL